MKFGKTLRTAIIIFTSLLLVLCLASCSDDPNGEGSGVTVLPDVGDPGASVTYTVSFDSAGGSPVNSITTTVGKTVAKPTDPSREGYTFKGWYKNQNLFNEWNFSSDIVTSAITLYAKWELNTDVYIGSDAFTYSAGRYTYAVSASTETVDLTGTLIFKAVNPTYTFYYDSSCKEQVCPSDTARFTPNYGYNDYFLKITYTAEEAGQPKEKVVPFTVKRNSMFTVYFKNGDGIEIGRLTCEEGFALASAVDYELIGYTVSWTDGQKTWSFGDGGTRVTGDTVLIADIKTKTYTATLDAGQDATVSVTSRTVEYGSKPTFPIPSKQGAGFVGWYDSFGRRLTGSNGVSEIAWDIDGNATLIAVWSGNTVNVVHAVILSGAVTHTENVTVTYGGTTSLDTYSPYSGILFDEETHTYSLYVFAGWYSAAGRVSKERVYNTDAITSEITFTEIWYMLNVCATDGADMELEFSANGNLTAYGSINTDETVLVTAKDCECGSHTFIGWSTGETADSVYVRANTDLTVYADWTRLEVSARTYLDGEETDNEILQDALIGLRAVREGNVAALSVLPLDAYTFVGWYGADGEELCDGYSKGFSYSFVMGRESVGLIAKWMTTSSLFDIKGKIVVGDEENSSEQTDQTVIAATAGRVTVNIPANENYVGGKAKLVSDIKNGYVLDGLYDAEGEQAVLPTDKSHTVVVPESRLELIAYFTENRVAVSANIMDAGLIKYKVNEENIVVGTVYGGNFVFGGVIAGSRVTVTAETYDGYIWLGWYRDGSFFTENTTFTVQSFDGEKAEYEACWKPSSYKVNIVPGIYLNMRTSSPDNFSYDKTTGLYTKGGVAANYVFSNNNPSGGTQFVTAETSGAYAGEDITLTATVGNGYRFDGWYDDKGELLTFSLTYTFNVKALAKEYKAWYTRIYEDSPLKLSIFGGTAEENASSGGEDVSYYTYKDYEVTGEVKEKCVITVATKKEESFTTEDGSGSKGYNYLGLYNNGANPEFSWTATNDVNARIDPMGGRGGLNPDNFTYTYVIDYPETEQNLFAVWRKQISTSANDYYVSSTIENSDPSMGSIYYIAYAGIIILVAEPKNGYLFLGWQTNDEPVKYVTSFVFDTESADRTKRYTALWRQINSASSETMLSLSGEIPEGCDVAVTGVGPVVSGSDVDEISLKATTGDGYIFLGWNNGGKLISTENTVALYRRIRDGAISYFVYDEKGNEIACSEVFEPKWSKCDANVRVDSLYAVSLTGFVMSGGVYYRLKTRSDIDFELNGAAWYDGYFFDGWYDAEDNLLGKEYELIVKQSELKNYYKAIWKKIDVNVRIITNGEGGSTATYAFYTALTDSGSTNLYLVFNAVPASGYTFTGWVDTIHMGTQSNDLQYVVNLGDIRNSSTFVNTFSFNAGFTPISARVLPSAKTVNNISLAAPDIVAYGTFYNITAKDINGYLFLGWQDSEGEFVFRERRYWGIAQSDYGELNAIYTPIVAYADNSFAYNEFKVDIPKEYEENVKYYAYMSNGLVTLEFNVDAPDGFIYKVVGGDGTVYAASQAEPFVVKIPAYGVEISEKHFEVSFLRISEVLDMHVKTEQQIDNVIFSKQGYYEKRGGFFTGASYYEQKYLLNAEFGSEGYSFVGWYNDSGVLLYNRKAFEVTDFGKDMLLVVRFGKYELSVINSDEEAGTVKTLGYDITLSFDLNTDKEEILDRIEGVPYQVLNAGDPIVYPSQVVGKDFGGYMFGGWFTREDCLEAFDFDSELLCNTTVYAGWISVEDYGATADNVLVADGRGKRTSLPNGETVYYFTALLNGEYVFNVNHSSKKQSTNVWFGEADKMSEARHMGVLYGDSDLDVVLQVESGKVYGIRLETDAEAGTGMLLTLSMPKIEVKGRRSARVPYGGAFTVSATPNSYDNAERTGYSFVGWADKNGNIVSEVVEMGSSESTRYSVYDETLTVSYGEYAEYANENGVIELVALWQRYKIDLITSGDDGGRAYVGMTVIEQGLGATEYVGARAWSLSAGPSENYEFVGWYLYDKKNEQFEENAFSANINYIFPIFDGLEDVLIKAEWAYVGSGTRYTVSYSLGMSDVVNSPYNLTEFNSESTANIVLYNPYRAYKDFTGKVTGYYVFEGWYTDSGFKNRITSINTREVHQNIILYAKWGAPIKNVEILTDVDGGRYFYMGVYPQSEVTSAEEITDMRYDEGSYPGTDYRASYRYYNKDDASIRYATAIIKVNGENVTKYYRCEPIRWNVVTDANGVVYALADSVLETSTFNSFTNSGNGSYANVWGSSSLLAWLTNSFYAINLSDIEREFVEKTVSEVANDEATGYPGYADQTRYPWAGQGTVRCPVFVPSYSEITNAKGGFKTNADRRARYSDYAVMRIAETGASNGYWLRSWGETASRAFAVDGDGNTVRLYVDSMCGVRPVIRLNTAYCL